MPPLSFDFSFILIITIPRAAAELTDVGIFKAATKVFGMLLNDSFALERFLGCEEVPLKHTKSDRGLLPFGRYPMRSLLFIRFSAYVRIFSYKGG